MSGVFESEDVVGGSARASPTMPAQAHKVRTAAKLRATRPVGNRIAGAHRQRDAAMAAASPHRPRKYGAILKSAPFGLPSRPLFRFQHHGASMSLVQGVDFQRLADKLSGHEANEVVGAGYGVAFERKDHVAGFDAGLRGGAPRLNAGDDHRAVLRNAGLVPQPPRQRRLRCSDADIGSPHASVAHQFTENELRGVGADGEAD